MRIRRERVSFRAHEILLEGMLGYSLDRTNAPGVVICHPHPQMGGSMDNNVVCALFDEFAERGFTALTFNFRGVGKSGGLYSGGEGEILDVLCAVDFLRGLERTGSRGVGLLGYSFGAWVGLRAAARSGGLIFCAGAVAPPLTVLPFDFLPGYSGRLFVTWGDRDGFCPSDEVERWMIAGSSCRVQGKAVAGTDHFFRGREREASRYLCDHFVECLPVQGI